MRKITIIFLLLAFFLLSHSQTKTDSLLNILPDKTGSERIEILLDIANTLRKNDPDTALYFTFEALSTAKEYRFLELTSRSYIQLGKIFNQMDAFDSVIFYFNKSLKIELKLDRKNKAAYCLASIGDSYMRNFNYGKAIEYLSQAIDLSRETGNKQKESMFLIYLGSCYSHTADYDNAIRYFTRSLNIIEEQNNEKLAGEVYNQIGAVYKKIDNLDKAAEFFQKSLEIREKINYPYGIAGSYNNIGLIHASKHELEQALENYYRALEINKKHGFTDYMAANLNNIASIYKKKEEYEKALEFYYQALQLNLETEREGSLPLNYKNIGYIHHKQGDEKLARECYSKGIKYAEKLGQKNDMRELYKEFSQLYEDIGAHKQALAYYKLFEAIKDSIMNEDKISTIAEIETKYETDKKDKENKLLLEEAANKEKTQFVLIITGLLLFVIAVLLFILFKIKSRSLKKSRQIAEKEVLLRDLENRSRKKEKQRLEELVFAEQKVNTLQEQRLDTLNQQMSMAAMQILNKTELLNEIKKVIEQKDFKEVSHKNDYKKLVSLIESNKSLDHDWDQFKKHFEKVHKSFFKKLSEEYPQLTANDHKVCAYLKIGLSSKEIARMLNITEQAVSKSRHRLRKKLQLKVSENLDEFISRF